MRLYDAHNHLQDERFGGAQAQVITTCAQVGVVRMVVNGSCEADWPDVVALAQAYPQVLPSFGYHPWHLETRGPGWQATLEGLLDRWPAAVGEIGLDRWKPDLPYAGQEEAFAWQLRLAAARDRPVTIHCLRAWGRLQSLLEANPRPARGFLLHSYGGPVEMVPPLAGLGAYFGFPGYFARPNKERHRATFRSVPPDRLLIETDAPDQALPGELNRFPWPAPPASSASGPNAGAALCAAPDPAPASRVVNHPANLAAVYEFAATMLGESLETFAARVEENFQRLFGGL